MDEKKMTIFFSKNTGNIEGVFSDEISFENAFFGRHEDVESYCLKVIVNFNVDILSRSYMYKIDLTTMSLKLKEEYTSKTIKLII